MAEILAALSSKAADGNFYYSGDTALTLRYETYRRVTKLRLRRLPIGDFYTMGIEDALRAAEPGRCEALWVSTTIPFRPSSLIGTLPAKQPRGAAKSFSCPPSAKPLTSRRLLKYWDGPRCCRIWCWPRRERLSL